jgi:hypothetical protein
MCQACGSRGFVIVAGRPQWCPACVKQVPGKGKRGGEA